MMMTAKPQTNEREILIESTYLLPSTSESNQDKTAETFLEILGARVRNPNTRSAYRVAWRAFLSFCSKRHLELEAVKAYHAALRKEGIKPHREFSADDQITEATLKLG